MKNVKSELWKKVSDDIDPVETDEWLTALDNIIENEGSERASFIIKKVLEHSRKKNIPFPAFLNTPYTNSISSDEQNDYPGDLKLEKKISALMRWNALAMVVKANKKFPELGGHIATYASSAELFEVGFHHFFKAHINESDCIYFQPHSSPGVYARAFLEGRINEEKLDNYRQETNKKGLSSYCHPWLMPSFWQFPTGSMGLGPLNAIYQARFMKYLHNREIKEIKNRKVWCFVGDGEMDEPESLAGLSVASREGLNNLIFVINCNLQRLDGPVRGNSSIIQELEGLFAGAGWSVIKVLWGSDWDKLFKKDKKNLILNRLHQMVDGELQTLSAMDGQFNREHVFNVNEELKELIKDLSDDDINKLLRGGHDPKKIFSAYTKAVNNEDGPTVILAQTKKGFGMGHWGEGKMTSHQQKKLGDDALLAFRDRFELPLTNDEAIKLKFIKPENSSPEIKYILNKRKSLGGFLPLRNTNDESFELPKNEIFKKLLNGSENRELSTTMIFVNLLSLLLKDKYIGNRIVPIVADEARTFGMQSLFRQIAIYSPFGQLYDPEDKDALLYYKESRKGQILEEGITEAGAISSWIAAATSYSIHNQTMIPFYIFYSCFGFQRIGDLLWSAGDSRAKGFLLGATAGRTTLSGEGLQHEDGSSHILFNSIPNCVSYDPTFGYELVTIILDGLERMYKKKEDIFYYITVMNENYSHPKIPKKQKDGILKGMYKIKNSSLSKKNCDGEVQLLGSGTILKEILHAAELLQKDWKIKANVWSVTSFTELRKEGLSIDRFNKINIKRKKTWIEICLADTVGPIIAATDYMRILPDMIRNWIPRKYITLGTDGYGRSDTRVNLRSFFEIDKYHIVLASIKALIDENKMPYDSLKKVISKYDLKISSEDPWKI